MADTRIKDLTTSVTSPNADDHWALDGATAGTRKMLVKDILQPDLGLRISIDGGGSAITIGIKGNVEVPFNCDINGWTLLADQTGSIVVDIWKGPYSTYPPVVGGAITGSTKPTISSAIKNQNLALTGWTTALTKGDILRFNVDLATSITRVMLALRAKRRV